MPKTKAKEHSFIDWIKDEFGEGYIAIDPERNAYHALKEALGEEARETAKCPSLNGFLRLDIFSCGCQRQYRGMAGPVIKTEQAYSVEVGGIEAVKPCEGHRGLIKSLRHREA